MMIKKIIVPALFILLANIAIAQRFEGGLLAGYNATQVDGDLYKGYDKPGILAGAFVQTDVAPAVFLGMEIKYSQKGSRYRKKYENEDPNKYIMRLNYIDVPVLAGFRTSNNGAIVAGASFGYLLQGKEYDINGPFVAQDQHAFNNFDLQPFIGFQFDMMEKIKLDLRFAYSVLPIRGLPGEDATNYYWLNNQFNNVISLALYYRLDR